MHSAPAVSYPVGRSRFHAWLLGLTGMGGALLGLLWRYECSPAAWHQALFAATLLGTGIAAVRAWRLSPSANLHWDGQTWRWIGTTAPVCGIPTVHLDFQFFMLLSLHMDDGKRLWLWPERSRDPGHWDALRRAVFAQSAPIPGGDAVANAQFDSHQVRELS